VGGGDLIPAFATGPGVQSPADLAHIHLAGSTLGIVGLGGIGRGIAKRAVAFEMNVVAVDPGPPEVPEYVRQLWSPENLDELLTVSDFVVISAPHTPRTASWFHREQFRRMKRSAWLINVGRGAIVELEDLSAALSNREISGAALDVFSVEPLPSEHPLWGMENVIITPHVGASSPRIAQRHLGVLLDNIDRFVNGQPLLNIVNKQEWF
jgi:phosphoglycerate dehydrogenase-like enzyme